jgi:hypothetical protein
MDIPRIEYVLERAARDAVGCSWLSPVVEGPAVLLDERLEVMLAWVVKDTNAVHVIHSAAQLLV